jgi:putative ABC transport system substrate-binding protein
LEEMYRLLAETVARIIDGADPATFPVQRPATFEFYVSLPVARRIGLSLPPAVLAQATDVLR